MAGRRLGLIARQDCGGLGTQTWEAYRHLRPDRTLVVDFGPDGRGGTIPGMYGPEVLVSRGVPRNRLVRQFLDGLDVVFTCETTYSVRLGALARELGVEIVVQANPEMFQPHQYPDARLVFPTDWEVHPGAAVLPVPVNRSVLPFRRRDRVEVLYHPAAPAMLDRNGTDLLLAALEYVETPCRLIVRGRECPAKVGVVEVEWRPNEARPYFELYPDEADALVLPRRYGGLCLPAQESASLGWPLICLDLAPLAGLGHAMTVPTCSSSTVRMQGGDFEVFDAKPWQVARTIDALLARDTGTMSAAADAWAESLSWEAWLPRYREMLC